MWDSGEGKMIKGLIVGLQFLTRLPINIPMDFDAKNIGRSTFFYPLIGMLLGFLAYIPYYFIGSYSRAVASFFVVFTMIILTGGLHLDGVSDMIDGFFSSRKKEKILEIMADSRIGAFGVLSLILVVLFKYIIISEFTDSKNLMYALIFSLGNGRFTVLNTMAYRQIIKPGGMGDMIGNSDNRKFIKMGQLLYIVILAAVNVKFLIPLIGAIIFEAVISHFSYKKLGGVTGDIYGAVIELTGDISLLIYLGVLEWI